MDVTESFNMTVTNESANFSDNTIYSFRSVINPPIQIPFKQFEVGVSKVILPKTTKPFLPKSQFVIGFVFEDRVPPGFRKRYDHEVTVEGGVFDSVELMTEHIESTIATSFLEFYIQNPDTFDIEKGLLPGVKCRVLIIRNHVTITKVVLTIFPPGYEYKTYIRLKGGLEMWHVLGFQNIVTKRLYDLPIRAKFPPSLNVVMSALVLYAPNLIVEQLLGDQMRPVLEMIPYSTNTEDNFLIYNVPNPIYKTVIGGYISTLQFELQEITGKAIYFDPGKIQLHLQFRPCQRMTKH